MAMVFTWIPIYMELAKKILGYRNRQEDLIKILRDLRDQKLPVIRLIDRDANGNDIPLKVMDPFTFFASFNRYQTNENRNDWGQERLGSVWSFCSFIFTDV
jgi:5-methylcytosine-specific restriction protein B